MIRPPAWEYYPEDNRSVTTPLVCELPRLLEHVDPDGSRLWISPQTVYDHLRWLEQSDITISAFYRQLAQEALADQEISLSWRQAIADRLNHANHLLGMRTEGTHNNELNSELDLQF